MRRIAFRCAVGVAVAALAACGGAGDQTGGSPASRELTQDEYTALVRRLYTPVHDRFLETIGPCLSRELAACQRRGRPVRERIEQMLDELARVDPPNRIASSDHLLRKGVAALGRAIAKQHEAIAAGDDAAFRRSINAVQQAIADIDAAAGEINARYPSAKLPTVH